MPTYPVKEVFPVGEKWQVCYESSGPSPDFLFFNNRDLGHTITLQAIEDAEPLHLTKDGGQTTLHLPPELIEQIKGMPAPANSPAVIPAQADSANTGSQLIAY